jgi:hypothetical protein
MKNLLITCALLAASAALSEASAISLAPVNGPGSYPYLGFVVGPASSSDNLSSGSADYALLTEANFTAAGAGPTASGNAYSAQNDETTVFMIDASQNITVQWVNANLSLPTTTLIYLPGSDGLLITGDFATFNAAFPGGFTVRFTYVPSNATTGLIQVFNSNTNASIGYVSGSYTNPGVSRFGITANSASALVINNPIGTVTPEPSSTTLFTAALGLLWLFRKSSGLRDPKIGTVSS